MVLPASNITGLGRDFTNQPDLQPVNPFDLLVLGFFIFVGTLLAAGWLYNWAQAQGMLNRRRLEAFVGLGFLGLVVLLGIALVVVYVNRL